MKPGWKTTEFNMVWVVGLVSSFGMADEAALVRAAAFITVGLVGLGYQLARGAAKRNGVEK